MELKEIKELFKTDIGQKIQKYIEVEITKMDSISDKITPFNFFGSMIEILAKQKAIKKLEDIMMITKLTKINIKDPKDRWD